MATRRKPRKLTAVKVNDVDPSDAALKRKMLRQGSHVLARIVRDNRGKGGDPDLSKWAKKQLEELPAVMKELEADETRELTRKISERRVGMATKRKAAVAAEEEKKEKKAAKKSEPTKAAKIARSCEDAVALYVLEKCDGSLTKLAKMTKAAVKKAYEKKKADKKIEKVNAAMERPNKGLSRMSLGNMLRCAVKTAVEKGDHKSEKSFMQSL